MRRNLLLLTAVVLAAVMLSGCVLWPFGKVTVKVVKPENEAKAALVTIKGLADDGQYSKRAFVKLEALFTDAYDDEEIEWTVDDKKVEVLVEPIFEEVEEEEVEAAEVDEKDEEKIVIGQKIEFKLRNGDVTLTGKVKEAPANDEVDE